MDVIIITPTKELRGETAKVKLPSQTHALGFTSVLAWKDPCSKPPGCRMDGKGGVRSQGSTWQLCHSQGLHILICTLTVPPHTARLLCGLRSLGLPFPGMEVCGTGVDIYCVDDHHLTKGPIGPVGRWFSPVGTGVIWGHEVRVAEE